MIACIKLLLHLMRPERTSDPQPLSLTDKQRWLDITIDVCKRLLGSFWFPIIRDTAQDAVGAYIVLSIGGYAGSLIAGKDFSSFRMCLKEFQTDSTSVIPYVCYGMVILDFSLWAAVLARLFYRAFLQLTPTPIRHYLRTVWRIFQRGSRLKPDKKSQAENRPYDS
jgi:hypothetical protein